MAARSGSADLPLHGGRVPRWLGERMTRLGAVDRRGDRRSNTAATSCCARLAHPFWFQSFGAVMGMDWHSSGITTSVHRRAEAGARAPRARTRACMSAAGAARIRARRRASSSRSASASASTARRLAQASRLVAKVDSAAVQDGFDLYLHGFIVADDGHWVVVQQGMNGDARQARRYHWLSEGLKSFVEAPHAAIDGPGAGRDRQPHRRARRGLAAATGRRARRARPRRRRAGAWRTAPDESRAAAAASRHARASRRAPGGHRRPAACTAISPPPPTAGRRISSNCC